MRRFFAVAAFLSALVALPTESLAAPSETGLSKMSPEAKAVVDFWTPQRRAAAIARDIVIDEDGNSFIRTQQGFQPIGSGSLIPVAKGATKPPSSTISLAQVTNPSDPMLLSSGRLYFSMGTKDYICSASVIDDGGTSDGFSTLITAAHCIEDETSTLSYAFNVLFIPNQQGTTGTGSDRNCANDPIGCWVANSAYIHSGWTSSSWSSNVRYDYGFIRISNSGAHAAGFTTADPALEIAVTPLAVKWDFTISGPVVSAYGYPKSSDPKLMYCSQTVSEINSKINWWLSSCGLTGGASGGPWMSAGQLISVNSWGYQGKPGMAGPKLNSTTKSVFDASKSACTSTPPTNIACTNFPSYTP